MAKKAKKAKKEKIFTVYGPFEVPVNKEIASRGIDEESISKFWKPKKNAENVDRKGCYVFAIRAGRGEKPIYVGKTTKSFQEEIFTGRKLAKYNKALISQKGTPIIYFAALVTTRGRINEKVIDEVESHLIQAGLAANPDLLTKTAVESWTIDGVVRSKGRRSGAAQALGKCLNLEQPTSRRRKTR